MSTNSVKCHENCGKSTYANILSEQTVKAVCCVLDILNLLESSVNLDRDSCTNRPSHQTVESAKQLFKYLFDQSAVFLILDPSGRQFSLNKHRSAMTYSGYRYLSGQCTKVPFLGKDIRIKPTQPNHHHIYLSDLANKCYNYQCATPQSFLNAICCLKQHLTTLMTLQE